MPLTSGRPAAAAKAPSPPPDDAAGDGNSFDRSSDTGELGTGTGTRASQVKLGVGAERRFHVSFRRKIQTFGWETPLFCGRPFLTHTPPFTTETKETSMVSRGVYVFGIELSREAYNMAKK